MTTNHDRATLLQAEVDDQDESYFRLLIDNHVKYLTIPGNLWSSEDLCFSPSLLSLLPSFPPGDWNDGLVTKDPETGQAHFVYTRKTAFAGVQNTWHDTFVEYTDLKIGEKLRIGIYEVTGPMFEDIVVAKFARFDWEIRYVENETTAYQWLQGSGIGPRFLGHLVEHGRVIGFLMERVIGARFASPEDLEVCQEALSRLHELGVKHGDTNRFNFLVCADEVVLIDYDTAQKCDDAASLQEEFDGLLGSLQDESAKGGFVVMRIHDKEIAAA